MEELDVDGCRKKILNSQKFLPVIQVKNTRSNRKLKCHGRPLNNGVDAMQWAAGKALHVT